MNNRKQQRRRSVFNAVFAATFVIILAVARTNFVGAIEPKASAQTTEVAARSADSFVDTIGVNVHLRYFDRVYYNGYNSIIKPKLIESGIRHARDGAYTFSGVSRDDVFYQRLRELGANGVKFNLLTGMPTQGGGEFTNYDLLDDVYSWGDGAIISFEGINEPNIQGVPDWINITRREQQKLWNTVRNNPSLNANVKVLGPTPIFGAAYDLGNVSNFLDYGNAHPYPGGFCPSCSNVYGQSVDTFMPEFTVPSGSKPMMMTETGYHNAVNTPGHGHRPASELAAGKYLPRLFFEYFNRGFVRTFSYEFIDGLPDPGRSEIESNFGLLRHDGSEKPAFTAVKNVISLLKDPGPAFTPSSLNYSLSGNTSDVHQTLLQKRDGTFYLALWLEKSSYDTGMRANEPQNPDLEPGRRRDFAVASQSVTLAFGAPLSEATIYSLDDAGNISGTAATISGNTIPLNVPDKITIIKLTPGASNNQPDLIVTDISWTPNSPLPNAAVTFTATIKNQGAAATPDNTIHGVGFSVNDTFVSWSDNTTAALAPGASRVVTANSGPLGSATWTAGAAGNYTVRAFVDDVNRIPNESDESNNQLSKQLTVSSSPVGGLFDGAVYELEPQCAPGKRLDVAGLGGDGAPMVIWPDSDGSNQRFRVVAVGGGAFELVPQHATSKRLDVSNANTVDGASVIIWEDKDGANQRWRAFDAGNGLFELEPTHAAGKRLDVSGANSADGTRVQLWTDNNTAAQRWRLLRL